MLFDLEIDPQEFTDLGEEPGCRDQIDRLYAYLGQWGRRMAQRVTMSDDDVRAARGAAMRRGILPFLVDGSEVPPEITQKYRGPIRQVHLTVEEEAGHDE